MNEAIEPGNVVRLRDEGPPAWMDEADAALYGGDLRDDRRSRSVAKPSADAHSVVRAIKATTFIWCDPLAIPLRPWVYGRWLLRNCITAVVAPGGVGKSSLMASTVLALATGRALLGKTVWDGPKRAWYWNLEDDGEELARQIQAAARYHRVSADDVGDRLFVDSGLDGAELCTAVDGANGFEIMRPVIEALVAELIARSIDVLIIDPFVSSHAISENDNGAIDTVAKEWARVAKRANCSIVLVHHTRKLGGMKATAEMSRGAVSLIDAARSTLVLNRMDEIEAKTFGIEGDDERRRIFNVQDDKANRAPAEKADWYRIESVDLGNGSSDGSAPGDSMGVVTCWTPPDALEGVTTDTLYRVQSLVAQRTGHDRYRADVQASAWAGRAVADIIGLSASSEAKADRAKINRLLRIWIENGALMKVQDKDGNRTVRTFVEVGHWAEPGGASPLKSEVMQGGAGVAPRAQRLTPPPVGGGGVAGVAGHGNEVGQNRFVKGNAALGLADGGRRDE